MGRADERWWAMQITKHGDRRDQQRNKIEFRRLPIISSRAGQAIEDTRSARAGQSRQSGSRAIPGSCLHSERRRKSGGCVHGKTCSSLARSVPAALSGDTATALVLERLRHHRPVGLRA
jgi:hypothetical protein